MDKRIMQTQRFRNTWQLAVVVLMSWLLAGCGINNIPRYDEQVKSAWSQVENQYQRRADLIPNLVETVKGFARQEQAMFDVWMTGVLGHAVTRDYRRPAAPR